MLTLKNQISELGGYKTQFTEEEKERLSKCFALIQGYILNNYKSKTSRDYVELQLHRNSYTHSYLVINLKDSKVYLSHRDYGSGKENYFCNNESRFVGWKYTMCLIVVERWQEIKEILDNYFNNVKSVSELCETFTI